MFQLASKYKLDMGCSKIQVAVVVLIALVVLMFGALLAVTIGFTADIEKFKSDTNSAQLEQQMGQNNINATFEGQLQQIMQDFSSAQMQQQQQQSMVNSSFETQLQQLRQEIGLAQQQLLEQQRAINSSSEERLQLNRNLNFTQMRIQQLDLNINITKQQQMVINSSLELSLLELRQNIFEAQQQQLELQIATNASFERRFEELINTTQQQQNEINSSLIIHLQELRQEINSAFQEQLEQQNAINSSLDMRLQELSDEFNSAQQLQLNQLNAINSSLLAHFQELSRNIDSVREQLKTLNSSLESSLQNLYQNVNLGEEERRQQQSVIDSILGQFLQLTQDISFLNSSITLIRHTQQINYLKTEAKISQLKFSLLKFSQQLRRNRCRRNCNAEQLEKFLIPKIFEIQDQIVEIGIELEVLGMIPTFPAPSCAALPSFLPSDLYWLRAYNGSAVRAFCDMNLTCGGTSGGWVKVARLDFNSTDNCPSGFVVQNDSNLNTCVPNAATPAGCVQVKRFSTFGLPYHKVCGRVIAYQFGTPDAFSRSISTQSLTVDSQYLDGISLTHGKSPRRHIWSFPVSATQNNTDQSGCPCTIGFNSTLPHFVGSNFFCDSATSNAAENVSYPDNPLFDGVGCDTTTTSCCSFNNPPWFYRKLPKPTADDIEMRVCQDESRSTEGIPIQVIDLYIQY